VRRALPCLLGQYPQRGPQDVHQPAAIHTDFRPTDWLTYGKGICQFVTGGGAWADIELPVSGPGGGSGTARPSAGVSVVVPTSRSRTIGARASTISSTILIPTRRPIPAGGSLIYRF
jgi:hypothetical protein